jgi:predicted nucleic acid-binding protein
VILVDTSVLSLAFRRRAIAGPEPPLVRIFRRLVEEDQRLAVPGIVLQELLSGVRTENEFARLQETMEGFPLVLATRENHVTAAKISNACRRAGISASAVDCLIAAIAVASRSQLLTGDEDFAHMAPLCNLRLHRDEGLTTARS